MRHPIVAGNWKMNGNRSMAVDLVTAISSGVDSLDDIDVVICPPSIYIPEVAGKLSGSRISWGGQDLDVNVQGAYTGAIAGDMLTDYNCRYCIVGHSERRTLYGETDDVVAQKFVRALECELIPILCIGETLEQREQGQTEATLARQLDAVLAVGNIESLSRAVLAYEPVWAIGTGKTATPEQAQDVHNFIRNKLSALDPVIAANLRIQYGGSVKADNAGELFSQPDVDGGLIGGASLNANDFVAICRAAVE